MSLKDQFQEILDRLTRIEELLTSTDPTSTHLAVICVRQNEFVGWCTVTLLPEKQHPTIDLGMIKTDDLIDRVTVSIIQRAVQAMSLFVAPNTTINIHLSKKMVCMQGQPVLPSIYQYHFQTDSQHPTMQKAQKKLETYLETHQCSQSVE